MTSTNRRYFISLNPGSLTEKSVCVTNDTALYLNKWGLAIDLEKSLAFKEVNAGEFFTLKMGGYKILVSGDLESADD